jgi:hypothetical protein
MFGQVADARGMAPIQEVLVAARNAVSGTNGQHFAADIHVDLIDIGRPSIGQLQWHELADALRTLSVIAAVIAAVFALTVFALTVLTLTAFVTVALSLVITVGVAPGVGAYRAGQADGNAKGCEAAGDQGAHRRLPFDQI